MKNQTRTRIQDLGTSAVPLPSLSEEELSLVAGGGCQEGSTPSYENNVCKVDKILICPSSGGCGGSPGGRP